MGMTVLLMLLVVMMMMIFQLLELLKVLMTTETNWLSTELAKLSPSRRTIPKRSHVDIEVRLHR